MFQSCLLAVSPVQTEVAKMYKYIICLLFVLLCALPCTCDYWSNGLLGNAFIKNLFTGTEFEQIKHCFVVDNPTVEENTANKLAKTCVWLDLVRKIVQRL